MAMTAMGRLNSKSKKILICSPKSRALHYRYTKDACNTKPKFDTDWMLEGLHRLKKKGCIEASWLSQETVNPVRCKPRVLHFGSSQTKNGIRGWDKLEGLVVPQA